MSSGGVTVLDINKTFLRLRSTVMTASVYVYVKQQLPEVSVFKASYPLATSL